MKHYGFHNFAIRINRSSGGGSVHYGFSFLNEAIRYYLNSGDDSINLIKTIIFSCLHIEQILKQELRKINPALMFERIDDDVFEYLVKKRWDKKEVSLIGTEIDSPPTAKVRTLITRFIEIKPEDKPYEQALEKLFRLRNKIVHPNPDGGITFIETELNLLLATVFNFIRSYSDEFINEEIQVEIAQIAESSNNALKSDLRKKIASARRLFKGFSKKKIEKKLLESPELRTDEYEEIFPLPCPACRQKSVSLILGVDYEWSKEDELSIPYPYTYIECRVCGLELTEREGEEISDHPSDYLESGQDWEPIRIFSKEDVDWS